MKPVIVMAGTPVDTQMGVDCLTAHGLTGLFCPVSTDPNQQTAFQISSMEEKVAAVTALLRSAQETHGCEKAFIYCNSLSGSVDFGPIARETGLKIVPWTFTAAWLPGTIPWRSSPPTPRAQRASSGPCSPPTRP